MLSPLSPACCSLSWRWAWRPAGWPWRTRRRHRAPRRSCSASLSDIGSYLNHELVIHVIPGKFVDGGESLKLDQPRASHGSGGGAVNVRSVIWSRWKLVVLQTARPYLSWSESPWWVPCLGGWDLSCLPPAGWQAPPSASPGPSESQTPFSSSWLVM